MKPAAPKDTVVALPKVKRPAPAPASKVPVISTPAKFIVVAVAASAAAIITLPPTDES